MTQEATKNPYERLLDDPRWKKLRDRIIRRDGGRCVQCGGKGEVHVHHSHYRAGRDPWEYREADLFTLCDVHHRKVHGIPEVSEHPTPRRPKYPLEGVELIEVIEGEREAAYQEANRLADEICEGQSEEAVDLFLRFLKARDRHDDLRHEARLMEETCGA